MAAATQPEKSAIADPVRTTMVEGAVEYTVDPAGEKRVLRKIDIFVTPIMFAVFFFQFLDKSCINYAAVFGLEADTHLDADGFSWVISIFCFGLMSAQWPCAYLLSRFPVAKVVGVTIVVWVTVEMCMAATTSFAGLAAARYFLGVCEGAASPSFVVLTSNWYRRREHPVRVAWWESTSGYSQIIGAVLMYLIGGAHLSLASWRVMFLVCGAATMCSGIVFLVYMPRDTSSAWFLKEGERRVATERLALDRATRDRESFDAAQVKEALLDVKTRLLFLMALFICIPSPILKFSSLVISGFGFSKFQTMLVGLPSGALQIFFIWAGALGTEYTRNLRCLLIVTFAVYYVVARRDNKKRDALLMGVPVAEGVVAPADSKEAEHVGVSLDSDMTDKQDLAFRYTL